MLVCKFFKLSEFSAIYFRSCSKSSQIFLNILKNKSKEFKLRCSLFFENPLWHFRRETELYLNINCNQFSIKRHTYIHLLQNKDKITKWVLIFLGNTELQYLAKRAMSLAFLSSKVKVASTLTSKTLKWSKRKFFRILPF